MKTFLMSAMALMVVAIPAHAQERSAGQAYDAQANYGALSAKLDMLLNQNKVIATTIDTINTNITKIEGCGATGMVWDGSKCVVAVPPGNPTPTTPTVSVALQTASFTDGGGCRSIMNTTYPYHPLAPCTYTKFCQQKGFDDVSAVIPGDPGHQEEYGHQGGYITVGATPATIYCVKAVVPSQ